MAGFHTLNWVRAKGGLFFRIEEGTMLYVRGSQRGGHEWDSKAKGGLSPQFNVCRVFYIPSIPTQVFSIINYLSNTQGRQTGLCQSQNHVAQNSIARKDPL